jgi:hypothetical protein
MKRVLNLGKLSRLVEGDPNEVTNDEILVIRDPNNPEMILDVQKRINGVLTSIISPDETEVTFAINPVPAGATVTINGQTTKSVTVKKGTAITYSVANTGYQTENGTDVACSNITRKIVLQLNPS